MKKYLFIYKSVIMSNLQYVFNIVTGFIGCFMMLFVFLNLWQYIYSNPSEIINGYTMNQMIWYVVITEILWVSLGGRKLCKTIIDDVRGGNITYNINKPYSYIGYSLVSHLGLFTIKGIIYTILGLLTGILFLKTFPSLNIISVIAVLLSGILATIISTLLIIFIGLFSFIIEDSNPFYWVYSKIILVIGTIFPIEYFPASIQPILKFSPIYVVSYGPAKLFVDFSWHNFFGVILAQLIYIFIAYSLCLLIYKKGVKNLNVNGG
ncbi:MAG: ABC transporter permease [Bacilli bacterium]|nr:ABC transporter permease [Bacilli bacterium]